jgi:hypothetical protein
MSKQIAFAVFLCVMGASIVFSYDVVLKNGKTIKGILLSENQDSFVIKDPSGLQMTFKKTNVDLEKTAAANRPPEKAATEKQSTEKKAESSESDKAKKPAKVYTEDDISRLRSKSAINDSGSSIKESKEENEDKKTEQKGEDYWKNRSAELFNGMHNAEQNYSELNRRCEKLKGATIQTHRLLSQKGENMDMAQATEEYCDRAEDAKGQYEQSKSDYENFMEQARQESVPPGWLKEQ